MSMRWECFGLMTIGIVAALRRLGKRRRAAFRGGAMQKARPIEGVMGRAGDDVVTRSPKPQYVK